MRDIVSGAGHDAAYMARVMPTVMIFGPCPGGVRHNGAESVEAGDIMAGVNVLPHAALDADCRFDRGLTFPHLVWVAGVQDE